MKRFGDRKDGQLIRKIDPMHFITPLIYPNRCDNEAFISERLDLTKTNEYLNKLNENNDGFKYTLFHIIVTAALKTIYLRPKMNRFIANKNFYQRNYVSVAFVVKKIFSDEGGEALAFLKAKGNETLKDVHQHIYEIVSESRSDKLDKSSESMDIFNKMPRLISKFIVWVITILDNFGWVPESLIASDPYYSSVLLTNLGSIKLHSGYHHLTNWGTCSVFVIVGEKKIRPFFDEDGNVTMKDSVDIGLTVDERIVDGYYYSKTVALLKKLIENPELLELPLNEEVDDK